LVSENALIRRAIAKLVCFHKRKKITHKGSGAERFLGRKNDRENWSLLAIIVKDTRCRISDI